MAFRERSAWVMVLALLLGGAFYVYAVASMSAAAGALVPPVLPTLLVYTFLLVVVAVAGHVVAALAAPRDAAAPHDERDRLIVARASHLSGYVLAAGVVLGLGVYLLGRQGDVLFYAVFGSLMLSHLTEYGLQIYLYRRGV